MFLAPTSRAKYAWAPSCRQSNERNLSLKQHCLRQLENASEFFSNSMKRGSARCAAVTVSRSTHHGSASAERRVSVLEARMSKTQQDAFCIGGSSPPNAQRDSLAHRNAVDLGHEKRFSAQKTVSERSVRKARQQLGRDVACRCLATRRHNEAGTTQPDVHRTIRESGPGNVSTNP
jgi:hypothetical protein